MSRDKKISLATDYSGNMKNTLYTILFIGVLSHVAYWGAPWWITAVLGFLAAFLFPLSPGAGINAGFWGGFFPWYGNALWMNAGNAGMLAAKVGQLFGGLKSWHLLSITGLMGGILGVLGYLSGRSIRNLIFPSKPYKRRSRRRGR